MLDHWRLDFTWIETDGIGVAIRTAYTTTFAVDVVEAARHARCAADLLMVTRASRVDVCIRTANTGAIGLRFTQRASTDAASTPG